MQPPRIPRTGGRVVDQHDAGTIVGGQRGQVLSRLVEHNPRLILQLVGTIICYYRNETEASVYYRNKTEAAIFCEAARNAMKQNIVIDIIRRPAIYGLKPSSGRQSDDHERSFRASLPVSFDLDIRRAPRHARMQFSTSDGLSPLDRIGLSLPRRRHRRYLADAARLVLAPGSQRRRPEAAAQGAQGNARHLRPWQ